MRSALDQALELSRGPELPNLLFHGAAGAGKKTTADALLDHLYGASTPARKDMVMYVDCSEGKGLRFVREDIKHFARTQVAARAGPKFKVVVLLNGDHLGPDAQSALRRCIEQFSHSTRFMMLVCDSRTLLLPILSRFCSLLCTGPKNEAEWHRQQVRSCVPSPPWGRNIDQTIEEALADWMNREESCLDAAHSLYRRGITALDVEDFLLRFREADGAPRLGESHVTSEPLLIACTLARYR